VDIEKIRERVRAGMLLIQSHAVQHALKEGFERKHMVEAVLTGTIVEEYPENHRAHLWENGLNEEGSAILARCLRIRRSGLCRVCHGLHTRRSGMGKAALSTPQHRQEEVESSYEYKSGTDM
jgi:hypothetical protein